MRKLYFLTACITSLVLCISSNARTNTPDVANFTFVVTAGTSNVAFTNTSTLGNEPGERRAFWSFGDGTGLWTGGLGGAQHHYNAAGTYSVCLKIYRISTSTGDSILSAQICKTVVIETECHANFQTTSSTADAFGKYLVAQPSHNQNKKPVRICWNFGDNHDTCIQYSTSYTGNYAVYHHYTQAGSFNVCVNILYDGGCEAHECHNLQIESPDSCHANFETVAANAAALGRYFVAQPSHNHNKKPVRICWNFGDNSDTCIQYSTSATGPYIQWHLYNQPGNYNVCVTILYDGGCEAHECHTIHIGDQDNCRGDFERIPFTTATNPLAIGVRALPWNINNTKPSKICWNFGDGAPDICINYGQDYTGNYATTHTYAAPGQYQVCVTIYYYGDCHATKCHPITILPTPPGCSVNIFEVTSSINSPERNFTAVVTSNPPHPVESICWHFGDGTDTCVAATTATGASLNMHHNFPGPGTYHVCVRVVFQGGCVAEKCIDVVFRSNADVCGGYMRDSIIGPRTFKFNGYAIHNPNDPVVGYHWTFGDGSAASGAEVTHTYNAAGEFRVCLTINTQSGCETRICNTVHVAGNTQTGLILSPNPVINNLHALFFSTHSETVTIRIVNSTGVVVRTYSRSVNVGANNWDFDLGTLAPGPYLFSVQSPNQLASALFLKQ